MDQKNPSELQTALKDRSHAHTLAKGLFSSASSSSSSLSSSVRREEEDTRRIKKRAQSKKQKWPRMVFVLFGTSRTSFSIPGEAVELPRFYFSSNPPAGHAPSGGDICWSFFATLVSDFPRVSDRGGARAIGNSTLWCVCLGVFFFVVFVLCPPAEYGDGFRNFVGSKAGTTFGRRCE